MEESSVQDKALRLVQFLREYVQLRTSITRDVRDYASATDGGVFWLKDLPEHDHCKAVFAQDRLPEDVWLSVQKPDLEDPPEPKLGLKPWVNNAARLQEPALRDKVFLPNPAFVEGEDSAAELEHALEDNPEVQEMWEEYLQEWRRWRYQNQRELAVQNAYNTLYSLYRTFNQNREASELVVGLGLATWKPEIDAPVRRHIMVAKTELAFDRVRGIITLRCPSPPEGASLSLEDEFLPVKPDLAERARINDFIEEVGNDIWDEAKLRPAFRALANTVDARNDLSFELEPQTTQGPHLNIAFAPALILRKRGLSGILKVYDDIGQQISSQGYVPLGLTRLVETQDDALPKGQSTHEDTASRLSPNETLYFPLPTNSEQERIAKSLMQRQGVLVQGPPGTGKSHTIANLVSHLLAQGKRVLVTSETARALEVLQDKIPEPVQALCVSLLGASSQSFSELNKCINDMTQRHAHYNASAYAAKIERLEQKLSEAKAQRAEVNKELMTLRGAETRSGQINSRYRGTASSIARQVQRDKPRYGWFRAKDRDEAPLTTLEALELLEGLRRFTPEHRQTLNLQTPSREDLPLPTGDEFAELVEHENWARDGRTGFDAVKGQETFREIQRLETSSRAELSQLAGEFLGALSSLRQRREPWVDEVVSDVLAGRASRWQVLYDNTDPLFKKENLREGARLADTTRTQLPEGADSQQVLADARVMRDHLESGKGWGFLGIPSGPAKGKTYLRKVNVDGKSAETYEVLRQLTFILSFKENLARVWQYWADKVTRPDLYELQVVELEEQSSTLQSVLDLQKVAQRLRNTLAECNLHLTVEVSPKGVEQLSRLLKAADAEASFELSAEPLEALHEELRYLAQGEAVHPITQRFLDALRERDKREWAATYNQFGDIESERTEMRRVDELLARLEQVAPEVAASLTSDPAHRTWDERIGHFEEAFAWSHAQHWLNKLNDANYHRELERNYDLLSKKINDITAELAAEKAWHHFLSRLTPKQSASLQAWQQAIKRVGRGTGRHAARYRRVAQEHMAECIPAIPAWVMPRFRLPETMSIKQGMFDVVIVDEASQTGIDGLFLNYIAKQVVVVGDDQQISPSNVGISEEKVTELQGRYLDGIHLGSLMGPAVSFYDMAKILFQSQSKIVLQEHFRCMPEIIRFSDTLCYAASGTPLIPLRNYPPDRLKPLQSVYISEGYQEGTSSNAVNKPEARAVVNTILTCVNSPEYEGKTMGVISLLGKRQADAIGNMLIEELGAEEVEARNLVWGDAYSFQGDERNVMFLSLVSAPGERAVSALTSESAKQRFNVAASRAKDQMWLFRSAKLEHMSPNLNCVRRKLVEFFTQHNHAVLNEHGIEDIAQLEVEARRRGEQSVAPSPFDSWFEVDVFLDLHRRGYRVTPQFPVAQYRIDLVVESRRGRLAIECDGDFWHGPEQYAHDMERQRQLERSGWEFYRIRGSHYYTDPQKALEPLWEELERREIYPARVESLDEDTLPKVAHL